MPQHTQGRWRTRLYACSEKVVVSPAGRPICVAKSADAERLTDCVNALDGMEPGAVAEALDAAQAALAELTPMRKAYPPSRLALGRLQEALERLRGQG